jgi:hypothetical protein
MWFVFRALPEIQTTSHTFVSEASKKFNTVIAALKMRELKIKKYG